MGLGGLEGVVYLDDQDKKMIVTRAGGMRPLLLADCHVPPDLRFTFYDQVHTTGKHSILCASCQVEDVPSRLSGVVVVLVNDIAGWSAVSRSPSNILNSSYFFVTHTAALVCFSAVSVTEATDRRPELPALTCCTACIHRNSQQFCESRYEISLSPLTCRPCRYGH